MNILIIVMLVFLSAVPAHAATFTPTPMCPTAVGSCGSQVSYPLRSDFSMAVGLPGHGPNEPTSCYDVLESDGQYTCRIVSGVEETGDKRDFTVRKDDALDNGDHPVYGHELVARDGITYEGCDQRQSGDWYCDYASRRPVSGRHYTDQGYVFNVFWSWQKHTRGQIGCALALNGFWSKGTWKAFIPALDSCLNGPMEAP